MTPTSPSRCRPAQLGLLLAGIAAFAGLPAAGAPSPAALPLPAARADHPLRASAQAFGAPLLVEVRDLPRERAVAALDAAVSEVAALERMTDLNRPGSEIAALNAAAGKEPRQVDPRLFAVLARGLDFCQWSEGRQGPLAHDLNTLWGRGINAPLAAPPQPNLLGLAIEAAGCRHLHLDAARKAVSLDAGCALDLVDFAAGAAIDHAVEVLRAHGSANAFVQIGGLQRGIGPGRDGLGWPVDLPALGGLREPLGRVYLRDQALAVATQQDHPLRVGGDELSPFINQRTGQPTDGVAATVAATTLAADAQALAATMAITGTRDGELLMGSIRPRPSILWLMGSGTGIPLLVEYRWTEVPKR
jgi:FAD:protein FMN transferase